MTLEKLYKMVMPYLLKRLMKLLRKHSNVMIQMLMKVNTLNKKIQIPVRFTTIITLFLNLVLLHVNCLDSDNQNSDASGPTIEEMKDVQLSDDLDSITDNLEEPIGIL